MMQDVVAGNVQVTIATPPRCWIRAVGRVRALAVAAKERHPLHADGADDGGSGLSQLRDSRRGVALFAPAGTPADVIAKLTAAVSRVVAGAPSRSSSAHAQLAWRFDT
jgi:tripartite-type tricarboxylate transporter receptor subunit TctC